LSAIPRLFAGSPLCIETVNVNTRVLKTSGTDAEQKHLKRGLNMLMLTIHGVTIAINKDRIERQAKIFAINLTLV